MNGDKIVSGHQRVEVHWNTPQKRAQLVIKVPRYSQICATGYDLRRNRLLGFKVSRYTGRVLENVLSVSKNHQVQSNLCYRLWFAMKSSPGHQRVKIHRNTPQKRSHLAKKAPRYSQNRAINYDLRWNRFLDINVSRYNETVLENVFSVSRNPQAQSEPSYKLWFAMKSSPGHQRVGVHWNTSQKCAP